MVRKMLSSMHTKRLNTKMGAIPRLPTLQIMSKNIYIFFFFNLIATTTK